RIERAWTRFGIYSERTVFSSAAIGRTVICLPATVRRLVWRRATLRPAARPHNRSIFGRTRFRYTTGVRGPPRRRNCKTPGRVMEPALIRPETSEGDRDTGWGRIKVFSTEEHVIRFSFGS